MERSSQYHQRALLPCAVLCAHLKWWKTSALQSTKSNPQSFTWNWGIWDSGHDTSVTFLSEFNELKEHSSISPHRSDHSQNVDKAIQVLAICIDVSQGVEVPWVFDWHMKKGEKSVFLLHICTQSYNRVGFSHQQPEETKKGAKQKFRIKMVRDFTKSKRITFVSGLQCSQTLH